MEADSLKRLTALSLAAGLALSLAACGKGSSSQSGGVDERGRQIIKMWTHNAGNDAELGAIEQIVGDYNESQDSYKVEIQAFPQDSYNTSVSAAAASRSLPCILDINGPNTASWAWAGYLAPLDGLEDRAGDFLDSVKGEWNGELYSIGYYDVALTMMARTSAIEDAGVRVPDIDDPWTAEEFAEALEAIKASGDYTNALDMQTGNTGEWWPYAYSPQLQSFGGDLIEREDFHSADGVLNGPEALEWAQWFRGLVTDGYMPLKSGADPAQDFFNGNTAILWTGSWSAAQARDSAIADDIVFLPARTSRAGPVIGGGSWQWSVSATCEQKEGALDYMEFAIQDQYVALVSSATGTVPATDAAAAEVPGYEPGGDNDIFRQLLQSYSVLRPPTPGYPYIATQFMKTSQDILNGADPQSALDQAVKQNDNNQKTNNFFAPQS
ncbi:extracellular solute-binding protein [Salana multivorans]